MGSTLFDEGTDGGSRISLRSVVEENQGGPGHPV